MSALQESLEADLARSRSELSTAVTTLRSEMTSGLESASHASASRFSTLRSEIERLRSEHKLRLDEAENAIANGSVTASALQESVRATPPTRASARACSEPSHRHVSCWRATRHLHAICTPSARRLPAICTPSARQARA